jgi:YD repeat-containing protein
MIPCRNLAAILVGLALAVASPVLAASSTPQPEDAKLYDASGRYQGRVTSDGRGKTKSYDKSGRYQGKAVRQGKTVKIYDKSGHYIGRVNTR